MKVTNELNLPSAFVMAVSTKPHNENNHVSVTTLLKGAKEIVLNKRHDEEITVDASELLWAVWGTAVHSIFEKQKDDDFKEEYFETPVSNMVVTGRLDSYNLSEEIISDWKTASVWKVKMGDFKDWKRQGLMYAWLLSKNGLKVKKCRFIALLKDFSKTKAKTEPDYPKKPIYIYEFPVTQSDLEDIEKFVTDKVKNLEKCFQMSDDDIPECSKEERWADGDKYAVMKDGRKTAIRVFDDYTTANNYIVNNKLDKAYVEHREPISRKCSEYCNCCEFCSYYKEHVENKGGEK